jgi:hypothetical protein
MLDEFTHESLTINISRNIKIKDVIDVPYMIKSVR